MTREPSQPPREAADVPEPEQFPAKASRNRGPSPLLPATERQKDYARTLGIDFAPDINRKALSELIDAAKERQFEERCQRLDALQDRENAVYLQLREQILAEADQEDARLSVATPEQMVDEFERREKCAILITFDSDAVEDFSDLMGVPITINASSEMDQQDMKNVLGQVGIMMTFRKSL